MREMYSAARGSGRSFGIRAAVALCGVLVATLAGLAGGAAQGQETEEETRKTAATPPYRATVVARGLALPWGLDFFPNGDAIVTERDSGRVLRVSPGGKVRTIQVIPEGGEGEGGLLGVALAPDFAQSREVYAYVSTRRDNRVVVFKPGGTPRAVFTGIPVGRIHNGGRIAFGPDGKLYIGTGDAGNTALSQQRGSLGGKILRINRDGTVPSDNPFGSAVWTYGHRNVQGLAWDGVGRMYATELGQATFDEVNRIVRGENYGWPEAEGPSSNPAYRNPLATFNPDNASPSGATVYRSNRIRAWRGDLFFAALKGERLWRLDRDDRGNVVRKNYLLRGTYGRLRAVEEGPNGALWLLTSNGTNDRVVRLSPR